MRLLLHKCVFKPVNFTLITVNANHVETAGAMAMLRMALKKMLSALDQAGLLGLIDAFQRGAETATAAVAYFDKDQGVRLLHDQVYFTLAAAVVALHQFQPLFFQKLKGEFFGLITGDAVHGEAGVAAGAGSVMLPGDFLGV